MIGKLHKAAHYELKEACVQPRYETPIYSLLASQRNYFYLSGMDLFEAHISDANSPDNGYENQPLATRMRPATLDECVGQAHLVGEGKILHRMITSGVIGSMIFYGPPSSGETTLAHVISREVDGYFDVINAVRDGM